MEGCGSRDADSRLLEGKNHNVLEALSLANAGVSRLTQFADYQHRLLNSDKWTNTIIWVRHALLHLKALIW